MIDFIISLKARNDVLFFFGLICFVFSLICLVLTQLTTIEVFNVNAWFKPFKFAFSTLLFSWAMAWYCAYLPDFNIRLFNWSVVILLGFEIVYIAIQAGRGKLSHFNISTPLYAILYQFMAFAATAVTLYTAYIGYLFWTLDFPDLPNHYVWAIRCSIVIFVVFALEGFVMGSRLTHTIGGPDGSAGLPLVQWSTRFGDPRVAHFIGMHALQVLPILSFFFLRNTMATLIVSGLYGLLAVWTLVQALQGKPLWQYGA